MDGSSWLLRDAEVEGVRRDVRVIGGRISEMGTDLPLCAGERAIDCGGSALLPGLADHHMHIWATAAARTSLDLSAWDPATAADPPGHGWLRLIGADQQWSKQELDERWPTRPVRMQHRSGALWMLNSAAVAALGTNLSSQERRTGELWRADARLRPLLQAANETDESDLAALGAELAAKGITHLTDATPDLEADTIATLSASMPQRVLSLSAASAAPAPQKFVIADHELPDLTTLAARLRAIHKQGRPVAVHAVSAVALVLAVTALADAGTIAGDRIEHAACCDDPTADRIARLGITVVTQPTIWARNRRSYLRESPPHEQQELWRYRSLVERGVRAVASSDAPYGHPDPWVTLQAAADHPDADGYRIDSEVMDPLTVLASMTTHPLAPASAPRRIQVGARADLTLLDVPLRLASRTSAATGRNPVRLTMVDGKVVASNSDPNPGSLAPSPPRA